MALTDHDGLYGVVRFANAARSIGLPTIFGAELHLSAPDGKAAVPYWTHPRGSPTRAALTWWSSHGERAGYARLSRTIGMAHLAAGEKGAAHTPSRACGGGGG